MEVPLEYPCWLFDSIFGWWWCWDCSWIAWQRTKTQWPSRNIDLVVLWKCQKRSWHWIIFFWALWQHWNCTEILMSKMKVRVGSLVKYLEDGDIGVVTKVLNFDDTTKNVSFYGSIFFFKDKREYHNFCVDISLPQDVSSIADCVLLSS